MTNADATIHNALGLWWSEVPHLPGETIGCIGATENADHLLQAENLLRKQGCTMAIAPMEGNTWRPHRAVIESNGRPPFLLEPTAAPFYETAGYHILARYSSSLIDLKTEPKDFSKLQNRLGREEIHIRPLQLDQLEQELTRIYSLSLRTFQNNFLYTPITEEEFLQMYQGLAPLLTPECAYLAECRGELVGFVFGYPDQDTFIVKTLAVLPQRRFAGLGTLLVETIQEQARSRGFHEAIHALQREDNQSLRISQRFQATVFRRYALFAKSL